MHDPKQILQSTLNHIKSTLPYSVDGNTITWISKNKKKSLVLTIPLTPLDFSSMTVKELSHTRVYNQPSFNTIHSLLEWLQDPDTSILTLQRV